MRMVALCRVIVLATVLGCIAPLARAQTTPPPAGAPAGPAGQGQKLQERARSGDAQSVAVPRFSLQRVDGGYLRLDAENGTVAFCAPRKPSWNCQSTSDDRTPGQKEVVCTPRGDPGWTCQALDVDRAALEKEITGLQQEVTSLKQDLDRRQGEVATLKQEFDRRREEGGSLKQEVERLREEAASMKQEFDRRQQEIASLKQVFDRRREEAASMKQEAERRREEVTSLRQEVRRRQDQITSLMQEADRRRDEMTALKQEITALRALPPPAPPPPPADKGNDLTITLPGGDDLARAGAYLQDTAQEAWHRLVEMISHFQRDVMRKS